MHCIFLFINSLGVCPGPVQLLMFTRFMLVLALPKDSPRLRGAEAPPPPVGGVHLYLKRSVIMTVPLTTLP